VEGERERCLAWGPYYESGRIQRGYIIRKLEIKFVHMNGLGRDPGCVTRRSFSTIEDRSSIPGAGQNNVLHTVKLALD